MGETVDTSVFCEQCQMWLNGPTQWTDHQQGKKHRQYVKEKHSKSLTKAKLVQEEHSDAVASNVRDDWVVVQQRSSAANLGPHWVIVEDWE